MSIKEEKRRVSKEAEFNKGLLKEYFAVHPYAREEEIRQAGYGEALDLYEGDVERAARDLLPFFKSLERTLNYIVSG